MRWWTNLKYKNRHSFCRAVWNPESSWGWVKVFLVRLTLYTRNPLTLHVAFDDDSSMGTSIKTKARPTAAAYNLLVGSKTSFRYRTVLIEPRVNMYMSVRCPNEMSAHTTMLPPPMSHVRWISETDCMCLLLSKPIHAYYLIAGKYRLIRKHSVARIRHS